MAWLCRVRVERVVIYPFGADMSLAAPNRSYGKDALIAFSGAAVNLLLAWGGYLYGGKTGEFLILCNLALAGMNLLPIGGLDGGMILTSLCSERMLPDTAERVLKVTSFFCLFFLYLSAVYILMILDGDPSLFVIVCFLFASIFLRRGTAGR